MSIEIREVADGAVIEVRVAPGAASDRILGEREGALRVSVSAAPEGGNANRALVRFLAKRLGVRRSCVRIASGKRDRRKTVLFAGIEPDDLRSAIDNVMEPG
jgi:uncharacterized protein (TIGR00251 family)